MHINECEREFKEECVLNGWLVATADCGVGPFFGRRCNRASNSRGRWVGICSVWSGCLQSLWREGWASIAMICTKVSALLIVVVLDSNYFSMVISYNGKRKNDEGARSLKYNAILENEIISPSSTTLGVRVTIAVESIGSKRGPGGDVYPKAIVGIGLEIRMGLLLDAWFGATTTVLPKDGGPRLKGINSLKLGRILFKVEAAVELRCAPTLNPYLTWVSYHRSWVATHRYVVLR
ncbi:hypothetical protein CRG98_015712 [Punica granatum]|uniref:Uncharacterized protein n=1 Tax=Punica granatum TaxID=22663 RepID=A0A2I0K5W5_PUNGR|nr:hypothetical protein CRG98_015712 [Punica granatum]